MDAKRVEAVGTDGKTETYPAGRGLSQDGYGDWLILDAEGRTIASRKRGKTDDIRVVFE